MARNSKSTEGAEVAADGSSQAMNCDEFQKLVGELTELKAAYADANEDAKTIKADYNAKRKAFKKRGGRLDELDEALKLKQMGEDDAASYLSGVLRYSRWLGMPIGAQSNIFDIVDEPPLTQKQNDAAVELRQFETGEIRGQVGDGPDENPHQAGTLEYAAWERGRKKGFAKFTASQVPKPSRKPSQKRGALPVPQVTENVTGSPLN
jgi:hypothetical protein